MRKSLEFSVDETGFKKIALDVHLFYWRDNASHMHNFNEEIILHSSIVNKFIFELLIK
jgi:hypothetical protein